ncbi:MAG: hypothetical protein ACI9OU_000244 [Candidatus Promineifilaceae bacterium]|jgi:hypothetical protein
MVRNMLNLDQIPDVHTHRKLERYELIAFLSVTETSNHIAFGNVVNINTEGVGIMCSVMVEKGQSYSLRIALPKEILGQVWFDVHAECMWLTEQQESGKMLAGLRFDEARIDAIEIIECLIRDYQR